MTARTVHQGDALAWLAGADLRGCSVITSLPDVSEVGKPLEDWKAWFAGAAGAVVAKLPADGVAIFFQTDIKVDGRWVDKGALVHAGATRAGGELLWHRIACRLPPGTIGMGRPAYAHLLCFARGWAPARPAAMPDVIADPGEKLWARGMGFSVCAHLVRFVREHTPSRTVVDPFCGRGTTLAVANAAGLDAVGVDLSANCCRRSRALLEVPAAALKILDGAPRARPERSLRAKCRPSF